MSRVRIVFFGSGAFGLPTLELLSRQHEIKLFVSQPDRPAGRGRRTVPTPIAAWAIGRDREPDLLRTEDVNASAVVERIAAVDADAFVVIAFGQKLGAELLRDRFAVNLHGSLLPRHRGAAPVNWTILAGDSMAGVTAITLAPRMDAGAILGIEATPVEPLETAGELHDRLSGLGAPLMATVLERHASGALRPIEQDEAAATRAPKLSRADAWVRFDDDADSVRRRIHGLTPWPGVSVHFARGDEVLVRDLRLHRVAAEHPAAGGPQRDGSRRVESHVPGRVAPDGSIDCGSGSLRPLEVQPAGKRLMAWEAFLRGHSAILGSIAESAVAAPPHDGTASGS